MDFLEDSFGAQTSPVELTDLVGTEIPPMVLPEGAIRNKAATTAMLASQPDQAISNYQMLLREGQEGKSFTQDSLEKLTLGKSSEIDMKGIMLIMGDKNISIEAKRQAIQAIKNSNFLKDSGVLLHTNSLAAASKGENIEQESSRLSSSDAIREIYDSRNAVQGLVNAHGATLDSVSATTMAGMIATFVAPFGNSVNVGTLKQRLSETQGKPMSTWETIKGFLLPGTTVMDMRKKLVQLPPSERAKYTQEITKALSANKNIIFGNDNQFAQFQKASNIFEAGGYSSTDEWLDNLANVLDVVGLGFIARGSKEAQSLAKTPTIPTPSAVVKTAPMAPTGPWELAQTTGKPTAGAYDAKIAALEEQRAGLLGDAGNLAEKGDVAKLKAEKAALEKPRTVNEVAKDIQFREGGTSKAAKEKASKIVADEQANYQGRAARIDAELERNAKAATVSQRIDAIDKQIEQLSKNNTPVFLKKTPIADLINRIEVNSVIRQENPAAPANIIGSANPEAGRNLFTAVFSSTSDEVAQALHGVTREQAIINEVFPQVLTESGAVTNKVMDIQRNLPKEIVDMGSESGAIHFTAGEKEQAMNRVVNDFKSAEGLAVNDAMSSFKLDGGTIRIQAVYGTTEGGFLKAEDAIAQAKYALRNRGLQDSEITVLARKGIDYVPVDLKDVAGKDGSYMVRINTSHDIDPTDIVKMESFDVKRNWFDRIAPLVSQQAGSASRYLMDAASMLHPIYTGAATVVSDATSKFDKLMLSIASDYSDKYVKLSKPRQLAVDAYIREANFKGIAYDRADLMARGFNNAEMDALKSWRNFWDGHYYLENADVVKSLNSQGYQLFKNANVELYAKPIPKNQNIAWFYDPAIDDVVRHGKGEGDILYAAGGTYSKLRRPVTINGIEVEHMIVRNTPTEYTRKLRNNDQVLNYRDGYFQIQYKAPKFVEEVTRSSNGAIIKAKAVAVAGDTKEAEFFANRMRSTQGKEYTVRGDVKALQTNSDAWWDLNSASGRIAQRHRGQLLEDASGLNHLGDGSYILDPVDSAVRAAKSIAGRTVARPMLESAKSRFINQYGDFLHDNGFGGKAWPKSVDEISAKGAETSSKVADARTTYEYINYLENGYINGIDNVYKWALNGIADMAGKYGLPSLERGANIAGEVSPTGWGKNGVFMAYIGTNVLRQWIVQPHQIVRTFAYNPVGWLSGNIEKLSVGFLTDVMGLGKNQSAEIIAFNKFMKDSGLLDAVDKSNLVRGTLLQASENTGNILYKTGKAVTDTTRKVGFDLGEQANLIGHAAAVYEKRTRAGQNLADKAIRDEAYSEIRAISYDMNFAGDMPYNQTTPSLILQFMQVPHKAMLQLTNRRIAPMDRLRMAAADIIMWGGPTALIADTLGADILPDNPFLRETVLWGLESAMFNHMFTYLSGDRVNLDFSSLAPYETTGWQRFFEAMYSGGISQMITNSPSGQLFGKDGRVRNAISAMGRYFGVVDDIDESPETFTEVMSEVLKISSGWNNGVKARILLDAQKKMDKYGNLIDKDVNNIEAYAQALGFTTGDTRDLYKFTMDMSKDVKKHSEDTLQVYNDIKRYYSQRLEVEATDPVFITKVTGRVMQVFKDDPVALAIIQHQWSLDMVGKDESLLRLFMKRSGIPDIKNLKDQVMSNGSISDEQKQLMIQRIDDVANIRIQNEESK